MEEYSISKGFLAEIMQHTDEIPELEELLDRNRFLTIKEASINKELEHLCFDLVLVDAAHKSVEEERSEVTKAAKMLNQVYAMALQVETHLNSLNLPELLCHKLQLYKMANEKDHQQRVENVKKRQEVLKNMEFREIVQQFRHLQIATKEAEEELADTEKKYQDLLFLKREKIKGHNLRFNHILVSVLMARKQILETEEALPFESTSSSLPSSFASFSLNSPNRQDNEKMSELEKPNIKRSILKKSASQMEDDPTPRRKSLRLIFAQESNDESSSSSNDSGKHITFATPLEQVRIIPNREDEPWREDYFYKNKSKKETSVQRFLFSSEEEKREALQRYCQWQAEKLQSLQEAASSGKEEAITEPEEVVPATFRLSLPKLKYPPTPSDSEEQFEHMDVIESKDEISKRSTLIRKREDDGGTSSDLTVKRFAYDIPYDIKKKDADIESSSEESSEDSSSDSSSESSNEDNEHGTLLVPMKSYKNDTNWTQLSSEESSSSSNDSDSDSSDDSTDETTASIIIPKTAIEDNIEEYEEDLFQSGSPNEDKKKFLSEKEEKPEKESENNIEQEEKKVSTDLEETLYKTKELKSADQEASSDDGSSPGNHDDEPASEWLPDITESSEVIEETPEELPTPMEVCDNVNDVVGAESKDEQNEIKKMDDEEQKDEVFSLDMLPLKPIVTNVEIIVPATQPRTNSTPGTSSFDQPGDDIPSTSTGKTHAKENSSDDVDVSDFLDMFPLAQARKAKEQNASNSSQNSFLNFSSSNFTFNDDFFFDDDYDDDKYKGINYDL